MKKQKEAVAFKEWFAWGWIGVFLLVALFNNGAFQGYGLTKADQIQFEKPFYISLIVAAFIGLWVLSNIRKGIQLERRNFAAITAIAMPLVYFISSLGGPTPYLSHLGLYAALIMFIFYCAGTMLVEFNRVIEWLPRIILIFGYLIVIYGFLNLFGNVFLLDSLSTTAEDGVRTSSIFQYANAYAVLLLILWIGALIEIGRSRRIAVRVFHGAMLVPILASFLLTLSRGAIVILPLVAIVTLLMFRFKQQLSMMIYSIIGGGLAFAIYSKLSDRGNEVMDQIRQAMNAGQAIPTTSFFSSESLSNWGLLIGDAIVMGLVTWAIQRFLEPRMKLNDVAGTRSRNQYVIPLVLIVIFVLGAVAVATNVLTKLLPPVLQARVEGINFKTNSVYERLTMYKDAFKIWKLHPIFGGGGGAWEAYYERIQTYSYASNQTHSFITQLLVEVGIVGLLVFLALIIWSIIVFIRSYRKSDEGRRSSLVFYFVVVMTVLLHSLIDFEMSYVLYDALVFLSLGVMMGTDRREVEVKWNRKWLKNTRYAMSAVLGVLLIIMVVQAGRGLYVYNQFRQVVQEAGKPNAAFPVIEQHLKNALKVNGDHPVILQQLATWYYQAYEQTQDKQYLSNADKEIQKLNRVEPHYRTGIELTYYIDRAKGNMSEALKLMQDAIFEHRFTQSFYEQVAVDLLADWEAKQKAGSGDAVALGQAIMSNYESMKQRDQTMKDLPDTVFPSRAFELSNIVRASAAKVQFASKKYSDTVSILQPGIKDDLSQPNDRDAALYYLAALRAQGQDDNNLYNRMVQADATMADQLDALVSGK